jgi:thymidylate synthase (FAD)
MKVQLIDSMASDLSVVQAAKVSTVGAESLTTESNEGLIKYLMRERHASPFEHSVFKFMVHGPIFVAREFMRHRIASYNEECLAGDTVITRMAPNGSTHKKNSTIEVLYRNWHYGVQDSMGRNRLLPSCKNIYVRSFDEETKLPTVSKVVDIVKSTGKTTWLVTTESGKSLRTSMDHKYFTPENGWMRLSELAVGDYVYRNGLVRVDGEPVVPPRLRQGIQIWTTQLKPHIIPSHGADCYVCKTHLEYDQVQLDHEVPMVVNIKFALDRDNIRPICKKCHRKKTSFEQRYASRGVNGSIRADRIVSIGDPRQEDTYDLVLEGPHHNFLANGIVVHNSGRYRELQPEFYLPTSQDRPLIQIGKTGDYKFEEQTDPELRDWTIQVMDESYNVAWTAYRAMLDAGIAKEVARMVLPVGIYSTWYVTINARSLMNFLSLRTAPNAQWEIRQIADAMELEFAQAMPITYAAWVANGCQSV